MIEWEGKYSTGISIIDEEHKKLIDIINNAIVVKQYNNVPEEEVLEILKGICEYALEHFATEETYMKKFNYPEYQSHLEEHHNFTMKTVDYCNRVIKDDYQIMDNLLEYLQQWLVHHIQEVDKKYADCFKKNGLK
jgi:hemerythrin-like metal-binding protein